MDESRKQNILEGLARQLKGRDRTRILFVCLGNICRSPAADGMMQAVVTQAGDEDRFEIDSCGTGGWHVGSLPDRRMRVHARDRGLELTHLCRQVETEDFNRFDIIIGMDDSNVQYLKRLAPDVESAAKIVPMSLFFSPGARYDHVPDPYYEGAEGFELVLDLLEDATRNLHGFALQALNAK